VPALFKKLTQKVLSVQGTAARTIDHLPDAVKLQLARLLGYSHQYPDLDAQHQVLLAVRQLQSNTALLTTNSVKSRRHFQAQMQALAGKPTAVAHVSDLTLETETGALEARFYIPEQESEDNALLMFYHGGGFVVGDLDTHDEACRLLCKYANIKVLSIAYRLAPEHPAPAAVEDCVAALKWAKSHAKKLDINPNRIVVGGDSAGGNLATVVSQVTKGTPAAPILQCLIYPVVDQFNQYQSHKTLSEGLFLSAKDTHYATKAYIESGELTLAHPLVTPMLGDLAGLPPALLITSGYDILRDEAEEYGRRLSALGNKVQHIRVANMGHGFINMTAISKSAKTATIQIGKDLRAMLNTL
jgi:acetyl esterase